MSDAKQFVRDLVDSGIHFGHRTSRWNPKMKPYIYGKKNLIHIIDVRETLKGLVAAQRFLSRIVASGRDVLFVGTKRQARSVVEEVGKQTGMPVVTERWLGGTLTNFRTIRSRLQRLEELERILHSPDVNKNYSKKMESSLKREYQKILRNLAGIRTMDRLPGALCVIDVRREHIAILEARKLSIPVVAIIDTDSDPDLVDIAIPGNDDAMRGIDLLLKQLAVAVSEGKTGRVAKEEQDKSQQQPQRAQRGRRRTTTAQAEQAAVEDEKGGPAASPVATPVAAPVEAPAAASAIPAPAANA